MSMITIDQPTLPTWAESGVLTVGGRSELLYVYRQDGKTLSKFISPEDMARAYAKLAYDTGVIPDGIMRMGYGQHGWWGILKTPPQIVEMSFLNDDPIRFRFLERSCWASPLIIASSQKRMANSSTHHLTMYMKMARSVGAAMLCRR